MHMRTDERAFDRISLIEGLLLRRVVIYAKLPVSASCQNVRGQLYLDAIYECILREEGGGMQH